LGKKHLSEKLLFYSRTVSSYRRDIENHTSKFYSSLTSGTNNTQSH